jgi:hypothetical protein
MHCPGNITYACRLSIKASMVAPAAESGIAHQDDSMLCGKWFFNFLH